MGRMADLPEASPSLRAQLLATEHWSLLASRSTAQGEVLTRISILLTLVSASLVSLALVGQATGFSGTFTPFSLVVLAVVVLVGVLTEIRVFNVGMEDLMYVLAMNRLRGAYVDLDPGVARYHFLGPRGSFVQVAGSTMMFIAAINATMVGLLASAVSASLGIEPSASAILGVGCGVVLLVVSLLLGGRKYTATWETYRPEFPSP
jgi:small-conductance mechanosensitive channel